MAATCPMCRAPFPNDTALDKHMPSCSYPLKHKEHRAKDEERKNRKK